MVRHRWISQDGKACLLASWFLSRDVAVHSGVVGASAPAPRCFKFRRKTRPGDPGGTTTADATVWQNPCSAAGGLCVVERSKASYEALCHWAFVSSYVLWKTTDSSSDVPRPILQLSLRHRPGKAARRSSAESAARH